MAPLYWPSIFIYSTKPTTNKNLYLSVVFLVEYRDIYFCIELLMVNTCYSIVLGLHGLLSLKLCVLCIEYLGLRGKRLPHGHGGLYHRPHQRLQTFSCRLCESIFCIRVYILYKSPYFVYKSRWTTNIRNIVFLLGTKEAQINVYDINALFRRWRTLVVKSFMWYFVM